MGITRSTDPLTFDDVDGIVVNESAPAPNVQGVAANVAILVGQTQRGPLGLTTVGSIGEFQEIYGKSNTHGVNLALRNKKFGSLKVIRAVAAAAAKATITFQEDATDTITFTAKNVGVYGNSIAVKVEAGTSSGRKYTVTDTTSGGVLNEEVYDNIVITDIVANIPFKNSLLVDVTVDSDAAEPDTAAATNLASGDDGTIADTDYQTAIAKAAEEGAGNVLFLDEYNATRNGYLKTHAADTQDKMVIVCGAEGDSVATAVSDAASYRDTDGRIIYAYPYVETSINGSLTYQAPASWVASIFSQTSPNVSIASVETAKFLAGMVGLKTALSRANHIALKDAGIASFEKDSDFGFKIKSAIVTQIANSSKITILRRRMADFLTNSVAKFLKNYQNAVNSKENRTLVKASMINFIEGLERDGILPADSEVSEGLAKLVDTESLNTASSIANGFFKILWKQRIFSEMRYIVLNAEIGESVVVTEQDV